MLRIALVVIALLAAGTVSVMTSRYLASQEERLEEAAQFVAPETVDVLVSASDLEIGRTLSERDLRWQAWPKDSVHPRYLVRQQQPDAVKTLAGAAVRQPIVAGEPLTEGKVLKRDGASVLSIILREGYRAVTIKVDEAIGIAGLVRPGDLVDVILTHRVAAAVDAATRGEQMVSEVIASSVRVLAVDQDVRSAEESAKQVKSITLEVDPNQAEAIALGRALGTLSLALRSAFVDSTPAEREQAYTSNADITGLLRSQRNQRARVLTVTRPLGAGALLSVDDMAWADLPKDADATDYVVEERDAPTRLRGSLLLTAAYPGEPLRRANLVRPNESRFVPMALRPGYRAISVAIAQNTAVGGFVSPGDLVDIIYTDDLTDSTEGASLKTRSWSEVVASAVRVLAIETALDPQTQMPSVGGTATLEASPEQAKKIALAANMGRITLALRSSGEQAPPPPDAITEPGGRNYVVDLDMSYGLRSLAAPGDEPSAAGAMPAPAGGERRRGMIVIRGSDRTTINLPN